MHANEYAWIDTMHPRTFTNFRNCEILLNNCLFGLQFESEWARGTWAWRETPLQGPPRSTYVRRGRKINNGDFLLYIKQNLRGKFYIRIEINDVSVCNLTSRDIWESKFSWVIIIIKSVFPFLSHDAILKYELYANFTIWKMNGMIFHKFAYMRRWDKLLLPFLPFYLSWLRNELISLIPRPLRGDLSDTRRSNILQLHSTPCNNK